MAPSSFAVIFDLDGVVVDNLHYHWLAWEAFCRAHDVWMDEKNFLQKYNGRVNAEILDDVFQKPLSEEEHAQFEKEKENYYRELYHPKLTLIPGLREFLEKLRNQNIPIGLGTAAPKDNVDFVLDTANIRSYFSVISDASGNVRGKPHPDIYTVAIQKLGINPGQCIVFEDSEFGIAAGLAAGAHVVALATTNPRERLGDAEMIIDDFTQISVDELHRLVQS